jgi:hypothetical protein
MGHNEALFSTSLMRLADELNFQPHPRRIALAAALHAFELCAKRVLLQHIKQLCLLEHHFN